MCSDRRATGGHPGSDMRQRFIGHMNWGSKLPHPYFFPASEKLLNLLQDVADHLGITVTAPGFYGPQGRKLRLSLADESINQKLQAFEYNKYRILNYEMETSALYGLSSMLGHHACTLCLAIANRKAGEVHRHHDQAMNQLISVLLEKITKLSD